MSKTLRSLAKDYANGVLDRGSYRTARDELLLGIISGKIPVLKIDYRPPLDIEDLDITRDKTTIKSQPAARQEPKPAAEIVPPPPPPKTRTPKSTAKPRPSPRPTANPAGISVSQPFSLPIMVILITTIIATIGLIIFITFNWSGNQQWFPVESQENNEPAAQQEQMPLQTLPNTGIELIEQFLANKNWTDSSLNQFLTEWNNLGVVEKNTAMASSVKTQLANAINRQLVEERALLSLGDTASVISRQHALVNFAEQIGINDPRIKVQEIDENLLPPATDDTIEVPAVEEPASNDMADPSVSIN